MNREIKFRAWTGGRMLDFKEVKDMHATPWQSPSLIWMQFTGLKDKNGKEIYEGDIIEWELSIGGKKDRMTMRFESENGVIGDEDAGMLRTAPYINSTSEIIGNIYENPDLLQSRDNKEEEIR